MKTPLSALLLPLAAAYPSSNLPLADISERSLNSFGSLSTASSAFGSTLKSRDLGAMTQNDVNNGVCKPVTILFARGTTEQGNMGTLAGPPFVTAVGKAVGDSNVAVQGIDYPADIPGFLAGGDKGGSQLMAQLVGKVMSSCPTTKLVMAGYSQGGQLVHNAASSLSSSQTAFVNSAVIFGDPDNGSPVGNVASSKTKVICHVGDDICAHGDLVLAPHLTYSMNAGEAASFVQSQVGTLSSASAASANATADSEEASAAASAAMAAESSAMTGALTAN